MKTFVTVLLMMMLAVPAFAFDFSTITFAITSSAKTSAPNLRIGVMKGQMGRDGSVSMQGMTLPTIYDYYLTKSKVFTFPAGTTAVTVQTDQDTKLYTGTDLTNYLLIYSGTDKTYVVK